MNLIFYQAILMIAFLSRETLAKQIIFVDTENGTKEDKRCWTRGLELPCQNVEFATEGVEQEATIIVIDKTIQVHGATSDEIRPQLDACPTWMYHNESTPNRTCQCGDSIHEVVMCNSTTKKVSIPDSYCMTYDVIKKSPVVGKCIFGTNRSKNKDMIHFELPSNSSELTENLCGRFNRRGQLCGQCKEGLSPLVYSYSFKCKNCTQSEHYTNWITYIAIAFVPLTLFYTFVVLFQFNANAPYLNGFILLSQLLANSANIRILNILVLRYKDLKLPLTIFASLYGIWNLDFFREVYPDICLDVSSLGALALDYAIAFYPILLIAISYLAITMYSKDFKLCVALWKPFAKCLKYFNKKEANMINVFSTFLLLSYVRVLTVTFDLLVFINVNDINGTVVGRFLYYDPTVEFFSTKHLPYAIVALIATTCVNFLPLCILLLYPTKFFHKCLNLIKFRHQSLHIFADSFQGCYKDGTNGTRDCRYFAALSFFLRIFLLGLYAFTLNSYFYALGAVILMGNSILYVIFQPYREKFQTYNAVDASMFLLGAMWFGSVQCIEIARIKGLRFQNLSFIITIVITTLPIVYLLSCIIMWLFKKMPSRKVCIKRKETSISEEATLFSDRMANPNRYHGSMGCTCTLPVDRRVNI